MANIGYRLRRPNSPELAGDYLHVLKSQEYQDGAK